MWALNRMNVQRPPPIEIPPLEDVNWNGEVAGPEVPNIPVNPYAGIPIGAPRAVPAGATNAVTYNSIVAGEQMADFHGEAALENPRYYKKSTFNSLELKGIPRRKENPFTRAPIEPGNVRFYTKEGGAKKRKTKSKRKQQRRRKTARRHG